jgi:hypothetical protein
LELESIKERILQECTGYPRIGFFKALINKPTIVTTRELCIPDKIIQYKDSVAIGPLVGIQYLFLAIIVLIVSYIADHYLEDDRHEWPLFITMAVCSGVAYLIFKQIGSLHQEIKISREGIEIKGDYFKWNNIFETFILITYTSKGGRFTFLVVVDKDQLISKFEITFLAIKPEMLSTIIEYYKAKSNS